MRFFDELPKDATPEQVRKSYTKFRPGMVREACRLLKLKFPKVLGKAGNILAILENPAGLEAAILAHNIVAYNRMSTRENWIAIGTKTKEWVILNFPKFRGWIARFIDLVKNWNWSTLFAQLDLPEPEGDEELLREELETATA